MSAGDKVIDFDFANAFTVDAENFKDPYHFTNAAATPIASILSGQSVARFTSFYREYGENTGTKRPF